MIYVARRVSCREIDRLDLCLFSSMVFAKSWNLIKSADLQEFAKLKKYIPPQPLWSEYTVKLWSNCKVKLKNKQVYPHQSRCDVITGRMWPMSRYFWIFARGQMVVSCFQGCFIFTKDNERKTNKGQADQFHDKTPSCLQPGILSCVFAS